MYEECWYLACCIHMLTAFHLACTDRIAPDHVCGVHAQAKALRWKLSTRRPDGAGDGFAEKHTDMTPEELKEKETHLVKQVSIEGAHMTDAEQLCTSQVTGTCQHLAHATVGGRGGLAV